jgi:hypothetical protein
VIVLVIVRPLHMNMCLIGNGYRDTAVWTSRPHYFTFLFVGLDEEWGLQKKGGYTRRIARSHFRCCYPHKVTWRSTQTSNTRSSHTSCKVHWGWLWDFRTFILNCNTFVISLSLNPLNAELNPICHLLALLGAHHIFHISGLRVKYQIKSKIT